MKKINESTLNTLYSFCYIVYGLYIVFELSVLILIPLFFILDIIFVSYMQRTKEKYATTNKISFKLASLTISTFLSFLFICLIIYHFIIYISV